MKQIYVEGISPRSGKRASAVLPLARKSTLALIKAGIIGPMLARIPCGFTAATLHGLLRTEEI